MSPSSLSLHDLLDVLLSDHIAKEVSYRQEELRRFEPYEKYLESRVQALASQLQVVVVDEQGNTERQGPSDSDIRRLAYRDRDVWAKNEWGDDMLEPTWKQTPWEYAVPILVSDHAFKGADPETDVDVQYGRLRWFLRLRRLLQQGEPEPLEHESLDHLADLAEEMNRLNSPELVDRLLLRLWAKYSDDCEGMELPKPAPAAEQATGRGDGEDDLSAYAMSFDGGHWHITFGSEKNFVNDSKGARHVAELLNRPQQGIPCQVLHGSTEASLKENDPAISKNDALEERAHLREEYAELRRSMEEKPHEILPEDQEREQAILARMKELTGLGGKPRQKEAAGAARTAVFRAVGRFKDSCREKGLNAFAEHLDAVLETGETPVYNGPLSWKISM
ncbi:MAG: hypothetical protein ACYC6Y_10415 [Thermoguttaceae bacterium]